MHVILPFFSIISRLLGVVANSARSDQQIQMQHLSLHLLSFLFLHSFFPILFLSVSHLLGVNADRAHSGQQIQHLSLRKLSTQSLFFVLSTFSVLSTKKTMHFFLLFFSYSFSHLLGVDVDRAHSDQQIQTRHDVTCVLHKLVQVLDRPSFLELVDKIRLQVAQLVGDCNVCCANETNEFVQRKFLKSDGGKKKTL